MSLIIKTAEDLAAEAKAQEDAKAQAEARAYLANTDWYVTRAMETGQAVPPDVTEKRKAARAIL